VGQLHEGVVDDQAWARAVNRVCETLDIPRLLMGAISCGGKRVEFTFGHRAAPHAVALLQGPLADPAHNPWLTLASTHPLRRVATVDDLGGLEHLKSTRMWSDFYVPFEMGECIGAPLERQPEYSNVLIVGRKTGAQSFSGKEKQALQALLPHIARAWRVKRAMAEMEAQIGSLKMVLDRIERAIVVAGPEGEIRFANRSADRLLSSGTAIDTRNGRLCATRPQHTEALRALIGRAAATSVGAESVAVDAVALPCDNQGAPLAVIAEPLAAVHSDTLGHVAAAGAILFIGDSEASRSPSSHRLQVVYGLTSAEARMASAIVDGGGMVSAARALNLSPNTAKYHLKAVFGKVGVTSQVQLVRRVMADVGGLAEPEKLRLGD
jgi:DNA-binding CsgD family transcriptional regulator/PAS domain-containing protein